MPDPHDRHARSKWEWGSPGQRSQERAAAAQDDPTRNKPPAKKDPDLCKGQHWKGPHTPEIEENPKAWLGGKRRVCNWGLRSWVREDEDPFGWFCQHVLICSGCGKDFGGVYFRRCPLYHDITRAEQEYLDGELAAYRKRRASWKTRTRRVIDGPTGYRKKRK